MNNDEIWKTYPEFDFIQGSNLGRVKTLDHWVIYKNGSKRLIKGHILPQQCDRYGYMKVQLHVSGKNVPRKTHRIVASCFLANPKHLPEVNHKDCNPKNNCANNLEWVTHQENIAYRDKLGHTARHNKPKKPVIAVNLKTSEVLRFESRREAGRQLNIDNRSIYAVVNGRLKQAGGYFFTGTDNEITEERLRKIKAGIRRRAVIVVSLKTLEVLFFESQMEAARQLGANAGSINKVIKGRHKSHHGYWFTNADESATENTRIKFGDSVARKVEKLLNEED
jgi:hypothetical protein